MQFSFQRIMSIARIIWLALFLPVFFLTAFGKGWSFVLLTTTFTLLGLGFQAYDYFTKRCN